MREYETTYILDPALTDADVQQSLTKLGELISRHGGGIIFSQNMGKKNLAYRLKKRTKGYYAYVNYCADNTCVPDIERTFKLDERILRYLTVKLDEDTDVETRKKQIVDEREALEKATAEQAANVVQTAGAAPSAGAVQVAVEVPTVEKGGTNA